VRIIVDRPIIEVYVLGGRIAWVHQDNFFNASATSVHLLQRWSAEDRGIKRLSVRHELKPAAAKTTLG
jgi:predicted alpha-1,6-mannanase (GH76 family)